MAILVSKGKKMMKCQDIPSSNRKVNTTGPEDRTE